MDGVWPRDYAIVSSPAPPGFRYAARYTVGPDSRKGGQPGQRTLDSLWPSDTPEGASTAKTRAYQGASSWYRDEIYLPSSFQPLSGTDFNALYELHNYPDSGADVDLWCGIVTDDGGYGPYADGRRSGQRLSCRIMGGGSYAHPADDYSPDDWFRNPDIRWHYFVGLANVPHNRWIDLLWHVQWSDRGDGLFEWWVNGVKRATWHGPTLLFYRDSGSGHPGPGQAYLEHGYYRSSSGRSTVSVYHGATAIGPTRASVTTGSR